MDKRVRAVVFGFRTVFCLPFWVFIVLWSLVYVFADRLERLTEKLNREIESAPRYAPDAFSLGAWMWLALSCAASYAVSP